MKFSARVKISRWNANIGQTLQKKLIHNNLLVVASRVPGSFSLQVQTRLPSWYVELSQSSCTVAPVPWKSCLKCLRWCMFMHIRVYEWMHLSASFRSLQTFFISLMRSPNNTGIRNTRLQGVDNARDGGGGGNMTNDLRGVVVAWADNSRFDHDRYSRGWVIFRSVDMHELDLQGWTAASSGARKWIIYLGDVGGGVRPRQRVDYSRTDLLQIRAARDES